MSKMKQGHWCVSSSKHTVLAGNCLPSERGSWPPDESALKSKGGAGEMVCEGQGNYYFKKAPGSFH